MAGRTEREWTLREPDPSLVREIGAATGLSRTAASVLVNRGIDGPGGAALFLGGTLRDIASPFLMKDLEKAAARLVDAGRRREPILVYADYDVDGATGAAILSLFLDEVFPGLPVHVHQNDRVADGYGLRKDPLDAAAAAGVRLVVTVDVGISDGEAVAYAASMGMDVIVTDHHVPAEPLPPALAVLDPKRPDCPYPEKELAGVGVAFLLACGVRKILRDEAGDNGSLPPNLRRYLDLVALGTVADMAPLRGDNRIFVRAGIEEIRRRPRTGLRALFAAAGLATAEADEADLAFRIGPRLNAAGRVGESRRSVDLLVADDEGLARRIAAALNDDNARRQREEARISRAAEAALADGSDPPEAIVLSAPDWHTGVLGIVASRIAERFHRPAVLLRIEGGEARGSGRSVGGFSLVDALAGLAPLLSRFGGHHEAAGLALPVGNLAAFGEGFRRAAARHAEGRPSGPRLAIDARVGLEEITGPLLSEFERLRPFGAGNEEPLLLAENVRVTRATPFGGEGQHVRFEVAGGGGRLEAVAFRRGDLPVPPGGRLDLVFTPQVSRYRGARSIRLVTRDLRPASAGPA